MPMHHVAILISAMLIIGCSSTGSTNQNRTASKVVEQVDLSNIEQLDIHTLIASFEENSTSSPFSGSVIELTGEVVAFALTEDNLYTVTIRDNDSDVICVFNNSIADKLGDGRAVHDGATITIQGQCFASGLFSSNSFSLDGCRIVSN